MDRTNKLSNNLLDRLSTVQFYINKLENFVLLLCLTSMPAFVILLMIGRYLKIPFPWAKEAAQYFLFYMVFFGASKAASTGSHVGTQIFLKIFSEKHRKIVSYFGSICFIAFGFIFGIISIKFVMFVHMIDRTTSTLPITLPYEIILLPLPFCFFTMAIHSLINTVRDFIKDRYA